MPITIIAPSIILYVAFLFWIAKVGESTRENKSSWTHHPFIYALALGVYCTSWTFYGLVGTASENGWSFLPILLGPMLMFTFGNKLLKRISLICRQENIHSLADFISSRYGKRQGIATTVTIIMLLATVPYIALQLKAVSSSLFLAVGAIDEFNPLVVTLVITASIVLFSVLICTKQVETSGYQPGLMTAIAFESLFKLIAFAIIAIVAVYVISTNDKPELSVKALHSFSDFSIDIRFITMTLISAFAVICLPRMFHITFVEQLSFRHYKTARWAFCLYLIIICVCIFLIAWAGNIAFSNGNIRGDDFVLALPLSIDSQLVMVVAFLGGFSAATAMIIVASVTLSRMVSNDVILPLLLKHSSLKYKNYSLILVSIRRLTVIAIIVLSYIYYSLFAENVALTSIGLIAFALAVQLMPSILFGLYYKLGNYKGVYAGLMAGTAVWFYALMIPLLSDANLIGDYLIENGLFGIAWLRPHHLLNIDISDAFTRSVIISLSANVAFYLIFSGLSTKVLLIDRIQAMTFSLAGRKPKSRKAITNVTYDDLESLLRQFLGDSKTSAFFYKLNKSDTNADSDFIKVCEEQLSNVIGVASARRLIRSLEEDSNFAMEDVFSMFEETTRALRFNQDMLYASFESISSGISICDADLRMVAWNKNYENMFNYPEGMLIIGRPLLDLFNHNAKVGLFGRSYKKAIQKRMHLFRSGNPYRVVRELPNGMIIEIKGVPLPNGGYVTTFDDITEFMGAQAELEIANSNLENRVAERTGTIENINENLLAEIKRRENTEAELIKAKAAADEANLNKSEFLAQASHDILQPLNAANLYSFALLENSELPELEAKTVTNLQRSIKSAETIISTLLEISRLDTGTIKPKYSVFSIHELLSNLVEQFRVTAHPDVEIRVVPSTLYIRSDKDSLSRVIQNLLSNAIKYTQNGKILIGCRRTENDVKVSVYDTGAGIPEKDLPLIHQDFYRCNTHISSGVGLGLAVARRFCNLLGHEISVESRVGVGSHFSVLIERADASDFVQATSNVTSINSFKGLKVLYIDDNFESLDATSSLLSRWECTVKTCSQTEHAVEICKRFKPHFILMDYQLGNETDGITLAKEIYAEYANENKICLVSGAPDKNIEDLANENDMDFLKKPVRPAQLRALLSLKVNT